MKENAKKSCGNLDTCIRQAKQFLGVAKYCNEQNQNSSCALIFPLFVNASLSCELFLKAIMILESTDSSFWRGHDLNELFKKISVDAQNKINSNYENKKLHISLQDLLDRYGNNFIKWRYCFENGSEGNSFGIIGFSESLEEYIEEISNLNIG
ncbi:hypothetical protein [Butyricicoccus pullicaecorum]|uniref:hypothetical protein n=1 Tax=Butyricicoccus pullicaecorum TaxID=501571 RepID=UPI0035200AB4